MRVVSMVSLNTRVVSLNTLPLFTVVLQGHCMQFVVPIKIFEKQPEKHLYICTKISMYMVSNHSNKGWQTTIVWLEVGV